MQTWKISPQAFIELSPPCAASAVVRTNTKQRTANRQAVLFRTRVDVRHMNRYLIAYISILHRIQTLNRAQFYELSQLAHINKLIFRNFALARVNY